MLISEQLPLLLEESQPEILTFYPVDATCDVPLALIWHYQSTVLPSATLGMRGSRPSLVALVASSIIQAMGPLPSWGQPTMGRVLGLAISPSCFLVLHLQQG